MWKPLTSSYRYVHTHACFDFWNICLLDPGIRIPVVARNCFLFSKTPELLWRPPSLLFSWVSRSFPWGKAAGVCKLVIMSAVPVRLHGIDRDIFTCTLGGRHIFHCDQSPLWVRVHLAVSWLTYGEEAMTVMSVPERSFVSSAWFAASLCWNLAYVAHNCTNYVQRGVTWPLDILCIWASCVKRGRRAVSPLNPAPPLMLAVPNRYCSIPCTRETNSLSYLPK